MKSTLRTDFSEVKSFFGFRVRLGNPDLDFQNLNPDFPIERTLNLLHFCRLAAVAVVVAYKLPNNCTITTNNGPFITPVNVITN